MQTYAIIDEEGQSQLICRRVCCMQTGLRKHAVQPHNDMKMNADFANRECNSLIYFKFCQRVRAESLMLHEDYT